MSKHISNQLLFGKGEGPKNIEIHGGADTIRFGVALPPEGLRNPVHLKGNIDTPRVHLENPAKELTLPYTDKDDQDTMLNYSFIVANYAERHITFFEDAGRPWQSVYVGELLLSEEFKRFGINSGKYQSPYKLAQFIKMNRSYFQEKEEKRR